MNVWGNWAGAPKGREKSTGQAQDYLALALPWINCGPGQAPARA